MKTNYVVQFYDSDMKDWVDLYDDHVSLDSAREQLDRVRHQDLWRIIKRSEEVIE